MISHRSGSVDSHALALGVNAGGVSDLAAGRNNRSPEADLTNSDSGATSSPAGEQEKVTQKRRTWYGLKVPSTPSDVTAQDVEHTFKDKEALEADSMMEEKARSAVRKVKLYAPLYNGLAAGLALCKCFAAILIYRTH